MRLFAINVLLNKLVYQSRNSFKMDLMLRHCLKLSIILEHYVKLKNEQGGREKFFNATIKEVTGIGLMKIEFDEKVKWDMIPFLNSSNINIFLNVTNKDYIYKIKDEKESRTPIAYNETVSHRLDFTWNVTKFVNHTLEIQLNFSSPLDISVGDDFDYIVFEVKNYTDVFKSILR